MPARDSLRETAWGTIRQAARLALAIAILLLALSTGARQVMGMPAPAGMVEDAQVIGTLGKSHLAPGDSLTASYEITNPGEDLLNYRLLLVQQGQLWGCDPGGADLEFTMEWTSGANQKLKPGESETAIVTLSFALAAGNRCQALPGWLQMRRQFLDKHEKGGVYACRPLETPGEYECWEIR